MAHGRACGELDAAAAAAVAATKITDKFASWSEQHKFAHPLGIDASDYSISLITFTYRIMVYSEFLCDEMDDPPLLGAKSTGERKFITHAVIFEKEDPRIDFQSRRVIEIQLVGRSLFRNTRGSRLKSLSRGSRC